MNTLPQEMVDYVVDFLHDDKPSLAACCMVHSSFLPAGSYHLFSKVTVGLRYPFHKQLLQLDESEEIATLFTLLLRTQRITSHLRDLTLECRDFVSPARPVDVQVIRRMVQLLPKLTTLSLHGLSLYHLDLEGDLPLSPCRPTLTRLEVEGSRVSWESLSLLLSSFTHIGELAFTRILSVDDLATLPIRPSAPIVIDTLSVSACARAQLSALLPPLQLVARRMPNTLRFSEVLLDDMEAVDEFIDASSASLKHLKLDLPDRWFSWDPPETSIERLTQHITIPSLQHLVSLHTLDITIPIKMSPAAFNVNRFLWIRLMEMLLSLPSASPIYTPYLFRAQNIRIPSHQANPPLRRLERIRITFGNPRWTALAELPYVLGVVRSLDWSLLDAVAERHWPEESRPRTALLFQPNPDAVRESGSESRKLELSIAARPSSRTRVESVVLERMSKRVRELTAFV